MIYQAGGALIFVVVLTASGCIDAPREDIPVDRLVAIAEMRLEEGRQEEALRLYHRAAEIDDWKAQLVLADYYKYGRFPSEDGSRFRTRRRDTVWANEWVGKASDLIRRDAETGDAEAMDALGKLYFAGAFGAKDKEEAMRWWTVAADAGNMQSALWLVQLQLMDSDVDSTTVATLHAAAEAEMPRAYSWLAHLYMVGRGVQQDFEQHVYWLRKAATQDEDAAVRARAEQSLRALANKGLIEVTSTVD